jgi:glycosyltransferase involved in cell wall biosynthesis
MGAIYPPTFGAARRIWGLATNLSNDFDVSVLTTTDRLSTTVVQGVRIIETPPAIPIPQRFRNKIGRALASEKATAKLVTLYANPYHMAVLAKMAASDGLDLVQLEFPFVAPEVGIFGQLGTRLILDAHGVEVDFIRELASSRGVPVSYLDLLRVFLIESLAIRLSSLVLCCSKHDLERLLSIYGGGEEKYLVAENGVDESFFEPVKPYPFKKPTILYLGSFDHAPNRYVISWILREIMPRVKKSIPKVQFAFVGSATWTTPPRLDEGLVFANVEDIRPFIRGAAVALSLPLHGSGTRLKTLEYMACGIPVVATTKGVEGQKLRNGTDLLVANDDQDISDSIVQLIHNPTRGREMAASGQREVRKRYTWKTIAHKTVGAYQRLIQ